MQKELDLLLFEACSSDEIDYIYVENLLQKGANPLGEVDNHGISDNLFSAFVDVIFDNDNTPDDLYKITELFFKYGMDISKPSIPYDNHNVLNPLWTFAFYSNECVLRTLKLLLDNGLNSEDADECWEHALFDLVNFDDSLSDEIDFELCYDYIKKLMLIASYPHVLNVDDDLRNEIWYDYNNYDITKFRQWNDFRFEIDTSYCDRYPQFYKSIVHIFEKSTGNEVWKFGVCLNYDDVYNSSYDDRYDFYENLYAAK